MNLRRNWVLHFICAMPIVLAFSAVLILASKGTCQDEPEIYVTDDEFEPNEGVGDITSGDDFDPANLGQVWQKNQNSFTRFPVWDKAAKKVDRFPVKHYRATTKLLPDHCKDSGGTLRKHTHFEKDYDAANLAKANDLWDQVFRNGPKRKDKSDPSVMTNCYTLALANFIKKGTYKYWMNLNEPPAGDAAAAFDADCVTVDKGEVQTNDVLMYDDFFPKKVTGGHCSAVAAASCKKVNTLEWKWNGSAVYQFNTQTFHTPYWAGAKDVGPTDQHLVPAGKVRRAKP